MTTNSTTTTTNSTLAWRRDGAREDESDATARIRAVAPYLVGPVAARLRALTATLEAYLSPASRVEFDIARGVLGVCLRMTRDRAPSVAFSARIGLFRLLRAFVEDDGDGDGLETLALKSIVFARVECDSWNEEAATHFRELSARFLRCDRRARRATREILRLIVDGRHRHAARAAAPAPKTPTTPVVARDRRRDDDIERARCRRRELDARRRDETRRAREDSERRERAFRRRAALARETYLSATS